MPRPGLGDGPTIAADAGRGTTMLNRLSWEGACARSTTRRGPRWGRCWRPRRRAGMRAGGPRAVGAAHPPGGHLPQRRRLLRARRPRREGRGALQDAPGGGGRLPRHAGGHGAGREQRALGGVPAEGRQRKAPDDKDEDPDTALRTVVLSLDGHAHDLQVGYIAAAPVWRPSYRLVVQPGGQADLQAWGIVENLSGEDWSSVKLSLVAGAPIAFEAQLGTPIIPDAPHRHRLGRGDPLRAQVRDQPGRPGPDGIPDKKDALAPRRPRAQVATAPEPPPPPASACHRAQPMPRRAPGRVEGRRGPPGKPPRPSLEGVPRATSSRPSRAT